MDQKNSGDGDKNMAVPKKEKKEKKKENEQNENPVTQALRSFVLPMLSKVNMSSPPVSEETAPLLEPVQPNDGLDGSMDPPA